MRSAERKDGCYLLRLRLYLTVICCFIKGRRVRRARCVGGVARDLRSEAKRSGSTSPPEQRERAPADP